MLVSGAPEPISSAKSLIIPEYIKSSSVLSGLSQESIRLKLFETGEYPPCLHFANVAHTVSDQIIIRCIRPKYKPIKVWHKVAH